MYNDEDHFTLGVFLFALEFVCPVLLGLFALAGFLGLAPAAFRPFSSCFFFFFLGFYRLKTEHSRGLNFNRNVVSANSHSECIRKAKTMILTCSLGFLLGVSMGTSCGISSSSSSSSSLTFSSPSPRDSVWLVTSSLFVLASLAWEHTSCWFDALKQWLFLSWIKTFQNPSWSHFFLGRFGLLLCFLQQLEVA